MLRGNQDEVWNGQYNDVRSETAVALRCLEHINMKNAQIKMRENVELYLEQKQE